MYVQVIVDLPASQVNHPFDYVVPEAWQDAIELGIRVNVPFGKRQLLGFVVGISQSSSYQGNVKPISEVLDYQSFLNPELVQLSQFLAEKLHAFRIDILQAMLPNMLRVKYQTVLTIKSIDKLNAVLAEENQSTIPEKIVEIDKKMLEQQLSKNQIKQLVQAGILGQEYRVIDQTTTKKIPVLTISHTAEEYQTIKERLAKNAKRQHQIIDYLIDKQFPVGHQILLTDFMDQVGVMRAHINIAIERQWVQLEEREAYRDPLENLNIPKTEPQRLKPSQQAAYQPMAEAIIQESGETFLLEGVTGSGKTEVYLQLIQVAINQGKSAILLVPEIALTPQMVRRVTSRFGLEVAVLHSNLTVTQRYDEWRRIINQEAHVVVGARSSIFAPLDNIGVIIIDEEHETTYKQTDNPRYHARDVASWRSHYHQAPLILGSATPSLESRARAEVGRYRHIMMSERINQRPLPPVEIVDMSKLLVSQTNHELSPQLEEKIKEKLAKNEQIILMLNRRGYASYLLCRECGFVVQCPRCDISLTYHKYENKLKCHYCDYQQSVPHACPQCHSEHLRQHGIGTQKLTATLEQVFPQARILRMDNDTTRKRGQHEAILSQFANQEADILVGTQMIAKGLDFKRVTLVGIVNADTSLYLPDFRASEKTFQLLTQVSGRTGRGQYPGEVVIQTYNPDHYVIQLAQRHDYEQFFYYEMKYRHTGNYPPYFYTTQITISSKNQGLAQRKSYDVKLALDKYLNQQNQVTILGPSKGSIARINDVYYFQLLLKYKDEKAVQTALDYVLSMSQEDIRKGIYIGIDHHPLFFM